MIMAWIIISPVNRYQSESKSVYLPLNKEIPYYSRFAFDRRRSQPVFRVVQTKIPNVIWYANRV